MRFLKIVLFVTFLVTTSYADKKTLNILVFQSFHHTVPWTKSFSVGLEKFAKNSSYTIEIYRESVDHIRLKESLSAKDWETYLLKKYKNITFDGIIIETIFAANIFQNIVTKEYEDIPKVYLTNLKVKSKKNSLVKHAPKYKLVQKSIDLIKMQNTNLKNIYVIEPSNYAEEISKILLEELSKEKFNLKILKNTTIEKLKTKLANLPSDSIVFYVSNFEDASGKKFLPKVFLEEIAKDAKVPIYSFWSALLGTNTIGGYMIDGEMAAKQSLEHLIFHHKNGHFGSELEYFKLFLDYNMLQKYNISKYPKDAVIINKPTPIWVNYPYETFFAIGIIIFLSLLLSFIVSLKIRNEKISRMEESLMIQSKQAALGRMLSVIAHQWRQPLNNVSVMVQTILLKYRKDKLNEELMVQFKNDMLKQINYMSETIDDFKDFYKLNDKKDIFDIKEELLKTITLFQNTYEKNSITIKTNELKSVSFLGYSNGLSHCFLVILQNAKDALNSSIQKNKEIQIDLQANNNKCIIKIQNNADHIDHEIMKKIFDPYFSTKKEKNGTGLGLYMVKVMIEKHFKGKVLVSNTPYGVCFEIHLVTSS